jgi:hypothetical protein
MARSHSLLAGRYRASTHTGFCACAAFIDTLSICSPVSILCVCTSFHAPLLGTLGKIVLCVSTFDYSTWSSCGVENDGLRLMACKLRYMCARHMTFCAGGHIDRRVKTYAALWVAWHEFAHALAAYDIISPCLKRVPLSYIVCFFAIQLFVGITRVPHSIKIVLKSSFHPHQTDLVIHAYSI